MEKTDSLNDLVKRDAYFRSECLIRGDYALGLQQILPIMFFEALKLYYNVALNIRISFRDSKFYLRVLLEDADKLLGVNLARKKIGGIIRHDGRIILLDNLSKSAGMIPYGRLRDIVALIKKLTGVRFLLASDASEIIEYLASYLVGFENRVFIVDLTKVRKPQVVLIIMGSLEKLSSIDVLEQWSKIFRNEILAKFVNALNAKTKLMEFLGII